MERKIHNRLLLLILLNHLGECNNGIIRLQSLVFQIERNIRGLGSTQTFNYKFVRWTYGPYSKELVEDMNVLREKNLIEINTLSLTRKGREHLRKSEKLFNDFYFLDDKVFYQESVTLNEMELSQMLLKVYGDNGLREAKMGKVIEDMKYVLPEYSRGW